MNSYNLQSEIKQNNLGISLVQWIKKVHEKRANDFRHLKRERYTDLITMEMKGNDIPGRKENIWHA